MIALIIVLVLVVLMVIILKPQGSKPMPVERTYRVSMHKTHDKASYLIDGEPSPTLHIKRGKRYHFILDDKADPIYLTSSSEGGPGVPGKIGEDVDDRGIAATGKDFYIITEQEATPGELYYQSTLVSGAGGKIVLH